ncbi:hypothetical protein NL676_036637 [Syzygium grande]|nr:hypothetical protein NL676_036637 [Syzygium grande]
MVRVAFARPVSPSPVIIDIRGDGRERQRLAKRCQGCEVTAEINGCRGVYSEHAGKAAIDCDDVKLAVQSKVNFTFSQPPPREVLLELARNRNKIPLPKTISGPGIPLPPEQDTLISPNYQLAIPRRQSAQALEEAEEDERSDANPSQEQKTDVQQSMPQRVSFPLSKHPK